MTKKTQTEYEREIRRQDEEHLALTLAKENRLREMGIDPDADAATQLLQLEKKLEELKNTAKNG